MKLYVQIMDDDGKILAEHDADACQPSAWTAPPGKPLVGKMPQNSDQTNTGTYELFRITFQPSTRVNKPNGWNDPIPSGQTPPFGFPPTSGLVNKPSPSFPQWNTSVPIKATQYPQPDSPTAVTSRG